MFLDLAQTNLSIHKYDLDLDIVLFPNRSLANFWAGIPSLNARTCIEFMDITMRNEAKYQKIVQKEETEIIK